MAIQHMSTIPREASTLILKIRSYIARSDLKNKAVSAVFCLFIRSDLTAQDRILRVLASLGWTQKYYIINSETILDTKNCIPIFKNEFPTIDVMQFGSFKHWASSQAYTDMITLPRN